MAPRSQSARAFTIPEMLAVIAIIVIILALLMPALGQARERARMAKCRSNMHQIGLASRGYTTDTRYLPTGWDTSKRVVCWIGEMWPYAPDGSFFYCPSAPAKAKWEGIKRGSGLPADSGYAYDQTRVPIHSFFSYGHNNGGSQDGHIPSLGVGDTWQQGWVMGAKVKSPSNFIMYGDSTVDGLWDHFIDEDYENGAGQSEYPADRHDAGAFLAFGDAHVEFDLQIHLWHLGTQGTFLPELRRRWNNDNEPH